MSTWLAMGLLIVSGLILILYHDQGSIAGMDSSSFAGITASVALLIWLSSSILRDYSGKAGDALRHAVTWIGLALLLVVIYTFRVELLEGTERVAHQLLPAGTHVKLSPYSSDKATVRIRIRDDGHFVAQTNVDKMPITMLVDTGASQIVLTSEDASRIGINLRDLKFVIPISTANGQTVAARIIINEVAIGPIKIPRVEALVAREGDLSKSLLGMSFLNRLRSFNFSGDFLILNS